VTYDASANAAPAGFKTAVQAAVQFFDTTFSNNITVNIAFGWGEVGGSALDASAVGESIGNYYNVSYATLRNALINADSGTPAIEQAVQALPTVNPTTGRFIMSSAEEKAVGLLGSSHISDGSVGLSSSDPFTFDPNNRAVAGAYDAIGTLEHEISEVLGRTVFTDPVNGNGPLDLFRYASAGVHTYQAGSAFFSLDGSTALKWFNDGSNGGDGGDWASGGGADAFNAFVHTGVLEPVSPTDIELMQLLGYTVYGSTLTGTAANNFTATFGGVLRQYTVGAGGATVTGGPEGVNDSLVNIHRIQFVDGYMAYAPTDTAGQTYRLYETALGRAPDPEGLAGWTSALNSGTGLQTVADAFAASAEFQTDYGALGNTAFVTQLYQNALHRAPDAGGLNNWVTDLNSGMTRAQVVVGFSESQEAINDFAAAVGQGLWVGNVDAAEVARLYDTALGRLPDLSGLANWTNTLEVGASLQTVANGFVGSAEFQANYGALDNTGFVSQLYQNALHRAPDTAGLNAWLAELNSGVSRAQVVLGFSDSAEHVADTAAHIDYGIWITG
jgi:hypothetical protein